MRLWPTNLKLSIHRGVQPDRTTPAPTNTPMSTAAEFLRQAQARAARIEGSIPKAISLEQAGYKALVQSLRNRQILTELFGIVYAIAELRYAVYALRRETFRRGFVVAPAFIQKGEKTGTLYKVKTTEEEAEEELIEPDEEQRTLLLEKMKSVNQFNQSLLEVFQELEDDVNITDDSWLIMPKEVVTMNGKAFLRVKEVLRHDPASIEFSLNEDGVPGASIGATRENRNKIVHLKKDPNGYYQPELNKDADGNQILPIFAIARFKNGTLYLFKDEVVHFSKFSPSKLYGFSPVLTVLENALSVAGADHAFYKAFYKRDVPKGMIFSAVSDPVAFQAQKKEAQEKLKNDPDYIPWLATKALTTGVKTEWIPLGVDIIKTYDSGIIDKLRDRILMIWGVSTPTSSDTATQDLNQMTVQSHAVEAAHHLYNTKVLPAIVKAWGINDWTLELRIPQEQIEAQELSLTDKRSTIAQRMFDMNFEILLNEDGMIVWHNPKVSDQLEEEEDDSPPTEDKKESPFSKNGDSPEEEPAQDSTLDIGRDERGMAKPKQEKEDANA